MPYGDTPHQVNGLQSDFRRLFYSDPEDALTVPVQLQAGYGVIKQGTAMAKNLSASGNVGKLVPYNPTTFDGTETSPGRVYAVADLASGATTVSVTIEDSYKFAVGDDIIINASSIAAVNGGAITAIDRTTYTNKAVITFTNAVTNGAPTADDAHVFVEAGDSSNNYSDCVGILGVAVDTGTGENSQGGQGVLILSNALLYTGMLLNLDSAAQTDINSTTFGQYTVLK